MLHVAQTAAYSIRVEQEKIIKLLSQFGRLQFHKDLGSFYSSYAKSSISHEDLARIIPNKAMLCRSLGCFHSEPTGNGPRRQRHHTTGKFARLFLTNHVTKYYRPIWLYQDLWLRNDK